jgi:hypothetical protein
MNGYMDLNMTGDPLADVVPMSGDHIIVNDANGRQMPRKVITVEVIVDSESQRTYRVHFDAEPQPFA